jgi:hypothetical protein
MIINTQEEFIQAGMNKAPIIELMSGTYYVVDYDIDWALKLIMNAGATLISINVKVGGIPREDFTHTCEEGVSIGYFNRYEDPVGEV